MQAHNLWNSLGEVIFLARYSIIYANSFVITRFAQQGSQIELCNYVSVLFMFSESVFEWIMNEIYKMLTSWVWK